MRKAAFSLVAIAALGACSDSVTGVTEEAGLLRSVVLTEGVGAPASQPAVPLEANITHSVDATAGGSSTSPLSLKPSSCVSGASQSVTVVYTVHGQQTNAASFKVNTSWTFDGSAWTGSTPLTISVPPRPNGSPDAIHTISVTVTNGSTANTGTTSFTITPFDVNDGGSGHKLNTSAAKATVHVAFVTCGVANTAPTIVVPTATVAIEATSSAGASVNPNAYVTASDVQDGDLTSSVSCTPAAGTFAIGEHTFNCSVTDAGGLTASASFTVKVEDTTPAAFTSIPSGTVTKIADNASGWAFAPGSFGITVADVNGVSEPATFTCTTAGGATTFAIGSTTAVSCKAKDARGNEEATATSFNVFVTLDLSGVTGFLSPLRMATPFSAHKRGSTIPHKLPAPKYADGSTASDLAAGLRLTLTWQGTGTTSDTQLVEDPATGSTAWRFEDGNYVFNAKSSTTWALGAWQTQVTYAGIVLATTTLAFNK